MLRKLRLSDYLLLLVLSGCLGFIAYDRYFKAAPTVAPTPIIYKIDPARQAEIDRLTRRLAIEPKTWSLLIILPKPQLQGRLHDDLMTACTRGELEPLAAKTTQFVYTEGIHEIPKEWKPYLEARKNAGEAVFVLLNEKEIVFRDLVAKDYLAVGGENGRCWTHVLVDDVSTTLKRYMEQK